MGYWTIQFMKVFFDTVAHFVKECFDALDSRGGQLFIAIMLFAVGFISYSVAHVDYGKEVAAMSIGALYQAMRAERTANPSSESRITETKTKVE